MECTYVYTCTCMCVDIIMSLIAIVYKCTSINIILNWRIDPLSLEHATHSIYNICPQDTSWIIRHARVYSCMSTGIYNNHWYTVCITCMLHIFSCKDTERFILVVVNPH